jgi:hypothetical protein
MHVPLRRAEALMSREFLNCPRGTAAHREMAAEGMTKDVNANIPNVRLPSRS